MQTRGVIVWGIFGILCLNKICEVILLFIWGAPGMCSKPLETNIGKKWQETIYIGNLIRDFLKGISRWEP